MNDDEEKKRLKLIRNGRRSIVAFTLYFFTINDEMPILWFLFGFKYTIRCSIYLPKV